MLDGQFGGMGQTNTSTKWTDFRLHPNSLAWPYQLAQPLHFDCVNGRILYTLPVS